MLKFDETQIISHLSGLPTSASIGFSAACATRLAPAYRVARHHVGTFVEDVLDLYLGDIWAYCIEQRPADWDAIAKKLEGTIPSEDEGASIAYEIVDDALAAAAYAARCVRDNNPRNAAWAAQRAYNAVDRFAAEQMNFGQYNQEAEAQLIANKFVQLELERQRQDLIAINAAPLNALIDALNAVRFAALCVSAVPLAELEGIIGPG